MWFEPRNKDEVCKVIEEDYLFGCIVVPKNCLNVGDFKYTIHTVEEPEKYSLYIYSKEPQDFLTRVAPKIRPLLKEGMELLAGSEPI